MEMARAPPSVVRPVDPLRWLRLRGFVRLIHIPVGTTQNVGLQIPQRIFDLLFRKHISPGGLSVAQGVRLDSSY